MENINFLKGFYSFILLFLLLCKNMLFLSQFEDIKMAFSSQNMEVKYWEGGD